jgi:hypothetical protein
MYIILSHRKISLYYNTKIILFIKFKLHSFVHFNREYNLLHSFVHFNREYNLLHSFVHFNREYNLFAKKISKMIIDLLSSSTTTITFKISKKYEDYLRRKSEQERVSLNTVENKILGEYIEWKQFIEKFGTIILSKEILILNLIRIGFLLLKCLSMHLRKIKLLK